MAKKNVDTACVTRFVQSSLSSSLATIVALALRTTFAGDPWGADGTRGAGAIVEALASSSFSSMSEIAEAG